MTYPPSYHLHQRQVKTQKQTQHLMVSNQMQQAIKLLQLPVQELSQAIDAELEQNPILEYFEEKTAEEGEKSNQEQPEEKELSFDDQDFEILRQLDEDFRDHFTQNDTNFSVKGTNDDKLRAFIDSSIHQEPSLFGYLMQQAQESFINPNFLPLAEEIIGNFNENGFLKTPLEEIALINSFRLDELEKVLSIIQTFDPYGIGASNLQESLLIQLRCLKKENTLAYRIVEEHYEDLVNNRIPLIQKKLDTSTNEINKAIENIIAKLDLHPGAWHSRLEAQHITPDVYIRQEENTLSVNINDDSVPSLRLNRKYMRMLKDETIALDTKDYIKSKVISAKWLLRNIYQRNDTIERIAQVIVARQSDFLINDQGKLVPMTMKSVADELELHESTIARTVSSKYIDTPRGIFQMRYFFTNALSTNEGEEISSKTVQNVLMEILNQEDKRKPLSDQAISNLMNQKGIECARRTVAKYRGILGIGNAQQRKKY